MPMSTATTSGSRWTGYAGLLAGFLLLFFLFRDIDLSASLALVASVGWASPLVLVPWGMLNLLETLGWRRVFPPGTRRIPFSSLFNLQLISETVSMSVPAGIAVGEPLRPFFCARVLGIGYPAGVASVIVRRLVLGLSQGLYTVLGAAAGFGFLQGGAAGLAGFGALGWIMILSGAAVAVVFGILLLALLEGGAASGLHRFLMAVPFRRLRERLLEKEKAFHQTDRELESFRAGGMPGIAVSVCYYTLSWAMLAVESYLVLRLLGADLSFSSVLAIDVSVTLLRTAVFFIPAGLGLQDAGFLFFFRAAAMPDAIVTGGAFVLLKRLREVLWYAAGYLLFYRYGKRFLPGEFPSGTAGTRGGTS